MLIAESDDMVCLGVIKGGKAINFFASMSFVLLLPAGLPSARAVDARSAKQRWFTDSPEHKN